MNDQNPPSPHSNVEDLVAYLDGELPPAASGRVDELLAADPALLVEIQRLERAWDLLDELPRGEVDDTFTRSTVEMVALAASQELATQAAQRPRRIRRQRLALACGLLAASLAGFLGVRLLTPNANQALLTDLRVIQHLDPYRQAGDIEFLRLLTDEGVFPPQEVSDAP